MMSDLLQYTLNHCDCHGVVFITQACLAFYHMAIPHMYTLRNCVPYF